MLFSLNLYPADTTESTLELILPISFRIDTFYGPDFPHFVKRMQGSRHYGLGSEFCIQKASFLVNLKVHYEKREEKPQPKREGQLRNSIFDSEAQIYKGIFRAVTFRTRLKFFKEEFSPFFYIPRSILFESFIPVDCNYSELWALIGVGLLWGDYRNDYFVAGFSSGCLWRRERLENGYIDMVYTRFPSHIFVLGPFLSLRVRMFNSPFSIFIDLESQRGINKEEEAILFSGGLNLKLFSPVELVLRFSKESSQTRKSKGAEGGIRIHF